MKVFENGFTRYHVAVFLVIWAGFTAWTYFITEHGLDAYNHDRLVLLSTCGTVLGPMTGAISRNFQSCCLEFSLKLLPYCAAFLVLGTLPSIVRLPIDSDATPLRLAAWTIGLCLWFMGGIVSLAHAVM